MDSASGAGGLNGSSQTLSGDRLLSGSGQTLSGNGELEQYQLVENGGIFEFAPVVFGDEGCYRCVAIGVASDPITVTGRQHAYFTTPNLIHLPYYITLFPLVSPEGSFCVSIKHGV